ncbi:MAG: hypothetical protein ABIH03_11475, partial [Pseudomonadota bacterium]
MESPVQELSGTTCILGTGTAIARRGDARRRTPLELHVEAARLALDDAKITRKQVGGVLTGRSPIGYDVHQFNMRVFNELKVVPEYTFELTCHGAGPLGMLQ